MLAGLALPSSRPVSRCRVVRLAGDLIEACVPLPDTALSRPVDQTDEREAT
jgi:hypothetical protein